MAWSKRRWKKMRPRRIMTPMQRLLQRMARQALGYFANAIVHGREREPMPWQGPVAPVARADEPVEQSVTIRAWSVPVFDLPDPDDREMQRLIEEHHEAFRRQVEQQTARMLQDACLYGDPDPDWIFVSGSDSTGGVLVKLSDDAFAVEKQP